MNGFGIQAEQVDLPRGAYHKSPRTYVTWDRRPVIGFSQNDHRAYLYPLCTPAGIPLTSESPTDHPHHNSVWIGADHVNALLPFGPDEDQRFEHATYSFYINDTFQGRASGRIIATDLVLGETGTSQLEVRQQLDWIGPAEWGAPTGRRLIRETRTTSLQFRDDPLSAFVIDVVSELTPTEWTLEIGPTRHAYFGIRLIEPLRPALGGQLVVPDGPTTIEQVVGQPGEWVSAQAEVFAGHQAGLVVARDTDTAPSPWSLHAWGTIDVNPLGPVARRLELGDTLTSRLRLVVHDGEGHPDQIGQLVRRAP